MASGKIEALGYVGLEVSDLAKWCDFATDILGLQAIDRTDGTIDLRMDSYATRLRLTKGPLDDLAFVGWEVRDAAALAALTVQLEERGVAVARGDVVLAIDRHVEDLIVFVDPEGNRHEAFYGPLQRTNIPFVSPAGATL